MAVAAYQIKNEPPKWLVDRAQRLLLCGYSAKRISELVEIPQWYVETLKQRGMF
jgi:hypothetical protein